MPGIRAVSDDYFADPSPQSLGWLRALETLTAIQPVAVFHKTIVIGINCGSRFGCCFGFEHFLGHAQCWQACAIPGRVPRMETRGLVQLQIETPLRDDPVDNCGSHAGSNAGERVAPAAA